MFGASGCEVGAGPACGQGIRIPLGPLVSRVHGIERKTAHSVAGAAEHPRAPVGSALMLEHGATSIQNVWSKIRHTDMTPAEFLTPLYTNDV